MNIAVAGLLNEEVGSIIPVQLQAKDLALDDVPQFRRVSLTGQLALLEDSLLLTGTLAGELTLTCARCLKEFQFPLAVALNEEFAAQPTEEQWAYGKDTVNLLPMVHDLVLLAIPPKPLHDQGCRGLCDICGKDLNQQPHQHRRSPTENQFSALKKLRK